MNREILFKGIRKDNGQWIEGDFSKLKTNRKSAFFINRIEIIEGTDCQFTGSTDINGKNVFEGDYDKDGNVVVWCDRCHGWQFGLLDIPTKEIFTNCQSCEGHFLFGDHIVDFEVIGNINDK